MSKNLNKEFDVGVAYDPNNEKGEYNGEEEIKRGNGSTFGAYFNLINALAGSGTLGLPAALKQGGWLGMGLIIISALFCIYTGNLLVKCMNVKNPKHKMETYPDVGYASFGILGRTVVQFCQYSIICGGVTLYLVLAGTNFKSIADANGNEISQVWWIIIAGLIVWVPFVLLKTIQEVALISVFGTLSTVVVVIVSVTLGIMDLPNITKAPVYEDVNWTGIPIALSTICFSYGGTVVYPHVYRSMKKPEHWNYILVAATATALVLYALIAGVCYYVYGDQTLSPIFKNLPDVNAKTAAVILISCHVLCASPVFLCSFALEIERWLNINVEKLGKFKEFICRLVLRTFIVVVLVVIGNVIPYFGNLMSLVGAISECMLIFLVPTLCHLKLFGIRGRPWYEYLWIALILVVAVVCVIFGSIDAVIGLIADYRKDHP
ncbi:hypothetical protein K502DRAFT_313867 [Neoconidiobolus thromboides FSU 785]|nr:hypothetical protein K502DRAFT_313867 [Neoconidiobolus thromboides FSU 785]